MGVRGLLSYILRNRNNGATQVADLVWEAAHAGRTGVTLLIDLADFAAWLLPKVDSLAKEYLPDRSCAVYGGEYAYHDEAISAIIFSLRAAGVFLEFFMDAPRGCGLVDAVTSAWTDEAKRRYQLDVDCAKAVRAWFRGERSDLPDEPRCLPALWYDQIRASLQRCGCQVWHLRAEEQAPLLSMGRNSDWSHVWGIVSDNVDWAIVRGVRLVPLTCFDIDGDLVAKALSASNGTWPMVARLSVGYTCADLLAELLRLGHPPREEEIREAAAKGKGRGPVGHGQWPYKWWNEQVLIELALLCGTDATIPFIQKHRLYQRLYLTVGADPIDSIVRWVRNQLYTNKLRWRDVQLEALSPILSNLASEDREFALALEASRVVYRQSLSGTKSVYAELQKLRASESKEWSIVAFPKDGEKQPDLPDACSLFFRSAALGRRVWLDVCLEDVFRNGSPLAQQLVGDLRRLTYLLFRHESPVIHEHGIPAEQRTGVHVSRVSLEDAPSQFPTFQAIQKWNFHQRWALFRKTVEHNLLLKQATDSLEPTADGEAPIKLSLETIVWEAYTTARNVPACTDASFLHSVLEYFASLNHRPELTLIREHEFDTMAALIALSCDASLPGAPLEEAPEWALQRFGEVKNQLCGMVSGNFHVNSEVRVPLRVSVLASWFQTVTRHLLDLARLLWLDVSEAGRPPMVWLPEPREFFSGTLLAGLYCGGAYDNWELQLPASDTAYQWKYVFRQMSQLRQEVVSSHWFKEWRRRFFSGLPRGTMKWPTREQLHEEIQKSQKNAEELPIDEHREKILAHIDKHRVTCIQGETGCGKSTRVPVFVMEDYLERKKKGQVEDEKFMLLCTQPRRIACISLANRVAGCLKERVGETIGYKISGDSNVKPGRTKCVYVTTGYLLQVLVNNPEQVKNYSHLILDEVHERDVDSDLLSLVIKLQMSGYGFKLVVMSATLQGDLFSRYFSEKKIKTIFVGVKRFPVEVLYLENLQDRYGGRSGWDERNIPDGARGLQAHFSHQAGRAIRDGERMFGTSGYDAEGLEDEAYQQPTKSEWDDTDEESDDSSDGSEFSSAPKTAAAKPKSRGRRKEVTPQIMRGLDILVYEIITRVANPGEGILIFLPGINEITELHETLMPLEDPDREGQMAWDPSLPRPDVTFKVFVLHSLIPKDEQEGAVFDAPAADSCHVILSSNIAESSLTIPKIRVVIDFGLRRQLIYDKRRHMSCLVTTWVSQASAKQRTGRTGRVFEGVNIRLYTKQFHESHMEEFDPPEMQTAPLEKLYVNVKHLSSKLPEYEITPTEKRKRTPKELLQLVAQPPAPDAVETSIAVLDQLGALTGPTEEASLTALGYLMMSVPLDVQLCRLVIFGAVFGFPCDGVVLAAGLSVTDPFTLPSHLIIKDPREYAEALKRSYETRLYFDHGHFSEPLMMRAVFVQWLVEFRQVLVDRCGGRKGGYRRENNRALYLRAAQAMASKFAVVPKRILHLANSVTDTSQRMRKFIPSGSDALKRLDSMVSLLQSGDKYFASSEEANAQLPKLEDLFCSDSWLLKSLLIVSFTPQFLYGCTKVRNEEPQAEVWGKKKKGKEGAKKEKNKMEQLLDEMVQLKLDPSKTIATQLELPRGKGWHTKQNPRLLDDLNLTFQMLTCGEEFSIHMSGENKVLISFDSSTEVASPFEAMIAKAPVVAKLSKEDSLVVDLGPPAHYIDLFGAGRFKFQAPLLSAERAEQEKAEKEAREKAKKEAEEKARADREAKAKAVAEARAKREAEQKARKEEQKARKEAEQKAKREAEEKAKKDAEDRARKEIEDKAAEEAAEKSMPPEPVESIVPSAEHAEGAEDGKDVNVDVGTKGQTDAAENGENAEATGASEDSKEAGLRTGCEAQDEPQETASADASNTVEIQEHAAEPVHAENAEQGQGVNVEDKKAEDIQTAQKDDRTPGEDGIVAAPTNGTEQLQAPETSQVAKSAELVETTVNATSDAAPQSPGKELPAVPEVEEAVEVEVEPENEEEDEECLPASIAVQGPQDLGPLMGIYKPVSPYEVNWEVWDPHNEPDQPALSKKGKVKKKKVTKGRCAWRNNIGFLCSSFIPEDSKLPGYMPEPCPNDIYAVYTTTQGGDSKDLSWVDGVTVLPAEGDNLVAFVLLVSFLRHQQDLSMDVDLQDGRIHAIRGLGGQEFTVSENQVLLVEDIAKINALRSALSNCFWTPAKAAVSAEDQDKGLDFTGYQGRRDDEIVPQIGTTSDAAERLKELLEALRGASTRNDTISEAEWNARYILRKPQLQTISMHGSLMAAKSISMHSSSTSAAVSKDQDFSLLAPFTDLVEEKRKAEAQQEEEDMRKRRAEEEKRRKKEEDKRTKKEMERRQREEEQRRREEERRQAALAKQKARQSKQQMKAEQETWARQDRQRQEAARAEAQPKAKVKAEAKAKRRQEPATKGAKKGKDNAEHSPQQQGSSPVSYGYEIPSLPAPWVAVPDPNSGRLYYWNQATNEVQWQPPSGSSSTPASSSGAAGGNMEMWNNYQFMAYQAQAAQMAAMQGGQFPSGQFQMQ